MMRIGKTLRSLKTPPVRVQPVVRRRSFGAWLEACASEAMQSEWCIDLAWPKWRTLFAKGRTPTEAVDALFEDVRRAHESPNDKGQPPGDTTMKQNHDEQTGAGLAAPTGSAVPLLSELEREWIDEAWEKYKAWIPHWTQTPPTHQGQYWHWNGDDTCSPLPMFILWSGTSGKCFVSAGQLGITEAIDCDKYGGWWMRLLAPPLPNIALSESGGDKPTT